MEIIHPAQHEVTDRSAHLNNSEIENFNSETIPSDNYRISLEHSSVDVGCSNNVESTKSTDIASWAVSHGITHTATKDLLNLLRNWIPDEGFPKDPRTLLGTPKNLCLVEKCGGTMYHFGLKNCILKSLSNGIKIFPQTHYKLKNIQNLLTLKVGIDGVPLTRSTNLCFWPILVSVDQALHQSVQVVSLFYGNSKPIGIEEYLEDFVHEMLELEGSGVVNNNVTYQVRIRCIVADAPARSFLKAIKNHNAYYGCERCYRKGKWSGRVIYPNNFEGQLHTDESFLNHTHNLHHAGFSPLVQLNLGMVSQIPLDYMHLCCLGIMKKLLLSWNDGPGHFKLPLKKRKIISSRLLSFSKQMPKLFSRKPRSLNDVHKWKATEFRQFMLYTGPLALLDVLDNQRYSHFLSFHVSMYIMCSEASESSEWLLFAKQLLEKFVEDIPILYHKDFLSYNMHSVKHLYIDVTHHGALDRFSAFEFENFLYKLKRMIRTNKHQLKQVIHRLQERDNIPSSFLGTTRNEIVDVQKGKYYLTIYGELVQIKKLICEDNVLVRSFQTMGLDYYPCLSEKMYIFKLLGKRLSKRLSISTLLKLCIDFNVDQITYVMPLVSGNVN